MIVDFHRITSFTGAKRSVVDMPALGFLFQLYPWALVGENAWRSNVRSSVVLSIRDRVCQFISLHFNLATPR
jgi:hypothetical protein